MSVAPMACRACGHTWACHVPTGPRLVRAGALAAPFMLIGLIGALHDPPKLVICALGAVVAGMAYQLILPACPACGSEFTKRLRGGAGPQMVEKPPGEETRQTLRRRH